MKQRTSQESPVVESGKGEKDKQQQMKITLVSDSRSKIVAGILRQTNPWNLKKKHLPGLSLFNMVVFVLFAFYPVKLISSMIEGNSKFGTC